MARLKIDPGDLFTGDQLGRNGRIRRETAQPGEQTGRADVVDPRYRRSRSTNFLSYQREIDERCAVAPMRLWDCHSAPTQLAELLP